jgi:hypothetical protein
LLVTATAMVIAVTAMDNQGLGGGSQLLQFVVKN